MESYFVNGYRKTSAAVLIGFYAAADCPYVLAISAFILTVSIARIISLFNPNTYWQLSTGLHIHHYVFGIFILAFAGYVAMVLKGPRATFFIAMLYGFGLGLTFDEFGMWLMGPDSAYRWNETGVLVVACAFLLGGACVYTYKRASVPSEEIEDRMSRIPSESEAEASAE